jgi:hypothetical protein
VTGITGEFLPAEHTWSKEEDLMEITWRKDVDKALDDARGKNRHLLLDFSAAPM